VVGISDLPMGMPRLVGALDSRLPLGATPLGAAVKGSLAYLNTRTAANADRRAALVIVSDGVPEGCTGNGQIEADLRMAQMRTPAISTFVVGVFGDDAPASARMLMETFAIAGGTGHAFIVSPNEQLSEKFLAALGEIRGAIVPCDLAIPKTDKAIDFTRVNVSVTSAGASRQLLYVQGRNGCDPTKGGWYYDVDPRMGTPTRVQLCEPICGGLKSDPKGKVELRFGCLSRIVE
jgi:hypothetical protein